jgi:hypothetical protein
MPDLSEPTGINFLVGLIVGGQLRQGGDDH